MTSFVPCSVCQKPIEYQSKTGICRHCLKRENCSEPECSETGRKKRGMCNRHYNQWRRKHGINKCTTDGCDKPSHARCLCINHYMQASEYHKTYKRPNSKTITCVGCKQNVQITTHNPQKYCSFACAMKSRIKPKPVKVKKTRPAKVVTLVQCGWCHALHGSKNKYCSQNCQFEANRLASKSRRSALRAALEDKDFSVLVSELERRSTITETGCWLWPTLNSKGYPVTSGSRRLHRSVIECKYGASLGSQHAHHKCANTACVNPKHLQPVTHRENIAEMMERQSLLSRIEELEQRLSQIAPNDPLLMVIPCRSAS